MEMLLQPMLCSCASLACYSPGHPLHFGRALCLSLQLEGTNCYGKHIHCRGWDMDRLLCVICWVYVESTLPRRVLFMQCGFQFFGSQFLCTLYFHYPLCCYSLCVCQVRDREVEVDLCDHLPSGVLVSVCPC